ncbi:MAG: hypothetical protein MI810_14955 [Flavobacteriales bacterium]|nr:hypothetical protein [Flavobacteriales bacterium]
MKGCLWFLVLIAHFGFAQQNDASLDTIPLHLLHKKSDGKLYVKGLTFSGVGVSISRGDTTKFCQYKNGLKNGQWVEYYHGGSKRGEGIYLDGMKNGKFLFYNSDGVVIQDGTYKKDKKEGDWYHNYIGEGYIVHENYENDHRNGDYLKLNQTGDTLEFGQYHLGYKTGDWVTITPDLGIKVSEYYPFANEKNIPDTVTVGTLKVIDGVYHYENVVYTGIALKKHPNGKVNQRITYKKGLIQSHEGFYNNGQAYIKTSFKNGKKHGKWYRFESDGTTTAIEYFVEGKKNGKFEYFNASGKKTAEIHYKNDLKNGKELKWHSQNPKYLKSELIYLNDTLHGVQRFYNRDGQLNLSKSYVMGKVEGETIHYYGKGKVRFREEYANGKLMNKTGYYPSGKLKSELQAMNDNSKELTSYFESGKIKEKGSYLNGKQNGKWIEYLENSGQIEFHREYKNGKLWHAEVIKGEGTSYFINSLKDSTFTQFSTKVQGQIIESNWDSLYSLCFADSVYWEGEQYSVVEFREMAEKHQREIFYSLLLEATKTGIKKLEDDSEINLPKSLIGEELYSNYAFSTSELESIFRKGKLTLPVNGDYIGIYSDNVPRSKNTAIIQGYPNYIDDGCTNDKGSYDGCWFKILYKGNLMYINDMDDCRYQSRKQVLFMKIKGDWKIIAFL